ncbi:MAG: Mur ligase family protein [Saprospiraceae bacterium]
MSQNNKLKTWRQALDYMYAKLPMYHRLGMVAYKKDLTNTIRLCNVCHNPQNELKTIHIAGTNGKGTTTHIIAGGLQAQGYKVGVYTSPHYKDFRERIKINGIYISKDYIIEFLNTYLSDIEHIQPSFFEVSVALAFKYFTDMKVDFAVIETGLGGRLDSTNIIRPLISVITNISFDHQAMLGNTLPEIANEKAGIIKHQIPVIIGESQPEVKNVFINKAREMNATLTFSDKVVRLEKTSEGQGFDDYDVFYHGKLMIRNLGIDMTGPFQEKNIITGIHSLIALSSVVNIDFEKVKSFFPQLKSKTGYLGRWQQLGIDPLIIADSAHNIAGISIIINALKNIPYDRLHIIIGFVNDKDISEILELLPSDAMYYFARANIPRGLDAKLLEDMAMEKGLKGKAYSSVRKAYAAARLKAKKNDLIFVGGSIFVVGEIL